MVLSPQFEQALVYAAILYSGQSRKGTSIPYVSHVLSVAALTLENGATEEEAIEALGDEVLIAATARIRDMLNADRATLYRVHPQQQLLRSKIAHGGEEKASFRSPRNRTLMRGIAG